ncbi:MAG: metallophosphoesterase family protein, partial [Armatimonadota bacterium]
VFSVLRILHLADMHLGYRPGNSNVPANLFEQRDRVLEQAVQVAMERDVNLFLIAGDLFDDYRPPEQLVEETIRSLKRLEQHGVLVVTVPGNHDEYTYPESVYRRQKDRWPGILVTNPMPEIVYSNSVGGEQVHIVSMAYIAGQTDASSPLKDFPARPETGMTLAVLHGTVGGWQQNERSLPLDEKALADSGYDYIALGHLHTNKQYEWKACYPGMVAGKGFADPGVGYFTLVTLDNAGARVEKIPAENVPVWHREEISVSEYDNYDTLVEDCQQRLKQRAGSPTQIVLKGFADFPISTERLKTDVGDYSVYLEVVDETQGFSDEFIDRLAREKTIRGLFVRKMKQRIDQAEDEEKRRLYRSSLIFGLEALGIGGDD